MGREAARAQSQRATLSLEVAWRAIQVNKTVPPRIADVCVQLAMLRRGILHVNKFASFTETTGGLQIAVNPHLVREVHQIDATRCKIFFDSNHYVVVDGTIVQVVSHIEAYST